ncbi:MAG: flagellar brake domain-containing protein [Clostridium sp.]|uniref:flagellar brake protein n=1 Tax=Clostridium sp. TaxID=1506 RepID=UPI00306508BC
MGVSITIEVNNRVEIQIKENGWAKSIIQEVDENSISIAMPIFNGIGYPLSEGEFISCNYNDGKGNIYKFEAEVIGRKFDRIPLIVIRTIGQYKKVQRRDFVRIPFINDIKYDVIEKYNDRILQDIETYDYKSGRSLDLSGGGMRIKVKEIISLQKLLIIKTKVGNKPVLAIGKIARVESVQGDEHIYGVKFEYIDNKVREEIIKFIFQNMRKAIKTK